MTRIGVGTLAMMLLASCAPGPQVNRSLFFTRNRGQVAGLSLSASPPGAER